jgi:indolepyruvate ferredoxin oxidoreductase beta subunit
LVAEVRVVEAIKEGETGLAANVVIVGALAGSRMLPIEIKNFEESIREIFSPKDVELNLKAFRKGVELTGSKAGIPATSKTRRRK